MRQRLGQELLKRVVVFGFVAALASIGSVQAVYNPSQLPDPSRRWSVSVAAREGYDDNINSSQDNRRGSSTTLVEPQLLLNFPQDQTFLGLRYTYDMIYYEADRRVTESHALDLLLSHRFNPRLVLDINETLRRGLDPGLVEVISGVPLIERQNGNFWYNALSCGLTYNMSRRWLVTLNQSWSHWAYDDASVAQGSDRDAYLATASAVYSMSPVTSLGFNYQFGLTAYAHPGPDNVLDLATHSVYLSLAHQFNPQLSLQLAGGATVGVFNDHQDTSPYASAALSYSYAPGSTLSAGLLYSLATSYTGSYRASDTLSLNAQIAHRITPKLRASLSVAYVYYSLRDLNPTLPTTLPAQENQTAVQLGTGLSYSFTRWFSADVNYSYDRVNSNVPGQAFDRNRVNAGLRLTY